MSASLKISADVSDITKSFMTLKKIVKDTVDPKVKSKTMTDFQKQIKAAQENLKEVGKEARALRLEQKLMVRGSEQELATRKKLLDIYKKQAELTRQTMSARNGAANSGGSGGMGTGPGGGAGGGQPPGGMNMSKMIAVASKALMAAGIGAFALKAIGAFDLGPAADQYKKGTKDRVRLRGLGVDSNSGVSAEKLAELGLTEQELNQRRIDSVSTLGRQGGSLQSELEKASFERSKGLQGGTMTNVAASLRANFGGKQADDVQMKLQASILANGIEDALGPYLDTATNLLSNINENGMTNTDELIKMYGVMAKNGARTPEQIAQALSTVNSAVKGSSGESNAFLQTAFARGGIGNGTIGSTRLNISSGGLFGLDRKELEERGYGVDQLDSMDKQGMFTGADKRAGVMLDQFKRSAGMSSGADMSSAKGGRQVALSHLSNSVFGTQGMGGFDALMMLEQVKSGKMSSKEFEKKLSDIKSGQSPEAERLSSINTTLEGHTEILQNINTNLAESLGKTSVKGSNILQRATNNRLRRADTNLNAIDEATGMFDKGNAIENADDYLTRGGLGESVFNAVGGMTGPRETNGQVDLRTQQQKIDDMLGNKGQGNLNPDQIQKAVEAGVTSGMGKANKQPIINNNTIKNKVVTPVSGKTGPR